MQVLHKEDHLKTRDGMLLYVHSWQAPTKGRALVGLIHDYGEHCCRYNWLGDTLVQAGFSVSSFDQRGHGKSEGMRGYINRYQSLRNDLQDFIDRLQLWAEDRPVFLLGQGTGAALLIHHWAGTSDGVTGVILASPTLKLPFRFTGMGLLYCRLASWFFPGLFLPGFMFNKPPNMLAADAKAIADFERDPFNYRGQMRNRTALELYRSIRQAAKLAGHLDGPTLILHGEADRLTAASECDAFFKAMPSSNKRLHIYPSASHELFKTREKEQVVADLVAWLEQQL